jgi:hypothetical protein
MVKTYYQIVNQKNKDVEDDPRQDGKINSVEGGINQRT